MIIPGWLGQPKGMLQILYEQGWIDLAKVHSPQKISYSKNGKQSIMDENGILRDDAKKYSLTPLLQQCADFQNEKSDLEHLCADLSKSNSKARILFTPEYHCNLAGEGIAYTQGFVKQIYRWYPISAKRSFSSFVALVNLSLGRITIQMCRSFSSKARSYMLGYIHAVKEEGLKKESDEKTNITTKVKLESSVKQNEKIHKMYHSHQDANCTDNSLAKSYKNASCDYSIALSPW